MSAVLGAAVVSLLSTFFVVNPPDNESMIIITTIKLLGGLFTYFMMSYIKKQNGLFIYWKKLQIGII